jgi:flagellin
MALSILNNIPSMAAQNQLSITGSNLQKTLFRLSSGSRINSGADDAAGLAIADGLHANVTALTQSARNATDGIGKLQVGDGALAQVTGLLNRAVTLATEAATGTVNGTQRTALQKEFQAIKDEIDRIGTKTTYNGDTIFTGGADVADGNTFNVGSAYADTAATITADGTDGSLTIVDTKTGTSKSYAITGGTTTVDDLMTTIMDDLGSGAGKLDASVTFSGGQLVIKDASGDGSLLVTSDIASASLPLASGTKSIGSSSVFLSDGTAGLSTTISTNIAELTSGAGGLGLTQDLTSDTNAKTALDQITAAIANVAGQRGTIGADINRLQSASSVMNSQVQNLSAAEDNIRAADIAQEVASMTKFNILNQTGISALAQANQMQQGVLSLLR